MLTLDLIRARISKGQILPRFLKQNDTRSLTRAAEIIQCFEAHQGKTRGELEESIGNAIGDGTDYLIWRGLAKLLYNRSDFAVESPVSCEEIRRVIFEEETKRHPAIRPERAEEIGAARSANNRQNILIAAGERLGLSPAVVERSMYADLDDQHRLQEFETLSSQELVQRYNVSLVQSILLRAVDMKMLVQPDKPSRLRQLFRFIKFYRLMYRVKALPLKKNLYSIVLDGPVSLFRLSQKYGFQLACFFPGLLLCKNFEMEANVLWGKDNRPLMLKIDSDHKLFSHYRDDGHYVCEEGQWLEKRWKQLKLPWTLHKEGPPIDLGGHAVVVPDYTLRSPDGREVFVEIIGYWRKTYLQNRMELFRAYGPKNLILLVSDRLRVSEEKASLSSDHIKILSYKGVIPPKDLLALAQSCVPPAKESDSGASNKIATKTKRTQKGTKTKKTNAKKNEKKPVKPVAKKTPKVSASSKKTRVKTKRSTANPAPKKKSSTL